MGYMAQGEQRTLDPTGRVIPAKLPSPHIQVSIAGSFPAPKFLASRSASSALMMPSISCYSTRLVQGCGSGLATHAVAWHAMMQRAALRSILIKICSACTAPGRHKCTVPPPPPPPRGHHCWKAKPSPHKQPSQEPPKRWSHVPLLSSLRWLSDQHVDQCVHAAYGGYASHLKLLIVPMKCNMP